MAEITRNEAAKLAAQVYALVCACPAGRVTTYGWLGTAVGYPRGARMIGWLMSRTPRRSHVPAQRVINSKGELTGSRAFGQPGRMRQLLEQEGIVFGEDGRVDLKRYGWNPMRDLSQEEREHILASASEHQVEISDELMELLRNDPASPFRITSSSL
jgi:methylated-DNA-protein-cysteine methyltransferase-like protein